MFQELFAEKPQAQRCGRALRSPWDYQVTCMVTVCINSCHGRDSFGLWTLAVPGSWWRDNHLTCTFKASIPLQISFHDTPDVQRKPFGDYESTS